MASKVPAIIIAAGESKRLGRAKAFVEVAGKTLLQHALQKVNLSKCEPVVVVTNQENLFEVTLQSKDAIVALNLNPKLGRTGSIQVGLKSIINDIGKVPEKVIFIPVDRPGWKANSISKLIESEFSSCLSSNGVKGHPVSLVGSDLHLILGANEDMPLRDIISFNSVDVDESLLHLNIDTEKDVNELLENEYFFEAL